LIKTACFSYLFWRTPRLAPCRTIFGFLFLCKLFFFADLSFLIFLNRAPSPGPLFYPSRHSPFSVWRESRPPASFRKFPSLFPRDRSTLSLALLRTLDDLLLKFFYPLLIFYSLFPPGEIRFVVRFFNMETSFSFPFFCEISLCFSSLLSDPFSRLFFLSGPWSFFLLGIFSSEFPPFFFYSVDIWFPFFRGIVSIRLSFLFLDICEIPQWPPSISSLIPFLLRETPPLSLLHEQCLLFPAFRWQIETPGTLFLKFFFSASLLVRTTTVSFPPSPTSLAWSFTLDINTS